MRFRKSRRFKPRVVKMKFQSFVDIATQADNMQVISVSAGGRNVLQRLAPFFGAYKYYKLGGVSIKLIPASTLPVDPTGLSYDEDDFQTVDPRDQLTPGMCRITNGEDIFEDLTGLTGDEQRQLYDNMLLDPRWYKWMLQTGVKRFGTPKYWQIGQLHQDKWPGATINIPRIDGTSDIIMGTGAVQVFMSDGTSSGQHNISGYFINPNSTPRGIFQTGHRGVLGWMPTDGISHMFGRENDPSMCAIPEIELFKILTPPMRKTNYYYRMFITETVYFREPIVMNINGFRPIDVFHRNNIPGPELPTEEVSLPTDLQYDIITGGNDGSS